MIKTRNLLIIGFIAMAISIAPAISTNSLNYGPTPDGDCDGAMPPSFCVYPPIGGGGGGGACGGWCYLSITQTEINSL